MKHWVRSPMGGCIFVVIAVVVSVAAATTTSSRDECYEKKIDLLFAKHLSYRVGPVLEYIQQTKAWKHDRRDVLDWGAGGGLLASYLANEGAGAVVAVNMDPVAVQAAKRRLAPFPHATSIQSSNENDLPIIIKQQFDIILSYQGALSLKGDRYQKLCVAAKACRNGGSIIIAQFQKVQLSNLPQFIQGVGFGCAVGMFLSLVLGLVHGMLRELLESFFLLYFVLRCSLLLALLFSEDDDDIALRVEMIGAGWPNIRKSSRLVFLPFQPLVEEKSSSWRSRYEAFTANVRMPIVVLKIYQGLKQPDDSSIKVPVNEGMTHRHHRLHKKISTTTDMDVESSSSSEEGDLLALL